MYYFRHRTDSEYWENLDVEGWTDEAAGMRDMVSNFAAIPKDDIIGRHILK